MAPFPAFLNLRDRRCLVVGGGAAAARKAERLLRAGAAVSVAAPSLGDELGNLQRQGRVRIIGRAFTAEMLEGCALVISASGRDDVDRSVSAAAQARKIPVNVVDRPELSSFTVPAVVERDPIVIGISSGGAAPLLARRLRAEIEARLPAGLGRLARFAGSFRGAVKAKIPDPRARLRFWEGVFDGPVAEAVLGGSETRARERMLALVNRPDSAATAPEGTVYIVGAGPGDPDLLTLRALRLMQQADLVIYDRLVGPAILDYVRRDAERVFVGKAPGRQQRSQAEINALMVREARAGRRVLRLKGGDPFVFGRGGEELDHLRAAGVAVEVVPGITAATGCAAAAGIPLTHRDHASAVTFVAGQLKPGAPEPDWAALAAARQTLAIYMGVAAAGRIAARLIAHGMDPATPAAVVENGTRPEQRVLTGTLAELGPMVAEGGIKGPALLIVGEVVALADTQALGALGALGGPAVELAVAV